MKRHMYFQQCFGLIILFIISMLLFGCGNKDIPKIQSERIESRHLMKYKRVDTNEAGVADGLHVCQYCEHDRRAMQKDNTSDTATPYVSPAWHKELTRAFSLVFQ